MIERHGEEQALCCGGPIVLGKHVCTVATSQPGHLRGQLGLVQRMTGAVGKLERGTTIQCRLAQRAAREILFIQGCVQHAGRQLTLCIDRLSTDSAASCTASLKVGCAWTMRARSSAEPWNSMAT